MLSIGKLRGGGAAARYYEQQVASGVEDYYAGRGEATGVFIGSGSIATGRDGLLEEGDLEVLLNGTGLRPSPDERAVAGFDLTFRAPKSASVLWGLAEPVVALQVREAHDEAVREAMTYLEREACRARRGKGGHLQVEGRGFVGAAFRHRTSRAEDPLLHTHVVVGNLTQGPDGRWTALDARHLFRHAKTAGFVYQAVLRDGMTERLGVRWGEVENGVADIDGIDPRVIEHFSRRREQIVAAMAERGVSSARAAQVATLDTRPDKPGSRPLGRLRDEWRSRAAELGLDADRLAALCERPVVDERWRFEGVAPESLTEHDSTVGRPELVQAVAAAHRSGGTLAELDRRAAELELRAEVVDVGARRRRSGIEEPQFSTQELLAAERRLMAAASEKRVALMVDPSQALAAEPRLDSDQQEVVRGLCASGWPVEVVRAPAGTGKTFVLAVARSAWAAEEVPVVGCALSARAALELEQQTGIASATIAGLRERFDSGYALPQGAVLVVDEAGMVGTRDLDVLAGATRQAEGKLVLVGDDRQLSEIHAGGAFAALADRQPALELRTVHRQRDAWDREALGHLRSGELEHWAAAYLEHDRIHVHDTADLARRQLIADWAKHAADGEAQLILAHRRQDVRELNTLARARLREEGRLGPDHHFGDRAFAVGDTVVATTNRRHAGLVNGQRLTVVAADDRALHLQPVGQDKQEIVLAHFSITDSDIDHGYAMTVHRAQGATVDRVLVLADDGLDRNLAYTALSRHRVEAHLHTTHDALTGDTGQPTDDPAQALANLVRRSSPKELAHQPHELEIFQRDAALDLGLGAGRDDGLDLGW